jgi:serine phosphatase RsbU (regulator of sigma subunit)
MLATQPEPSQPNPFPPSTLLSERSPLPTALPALAGLDLRALYDSVRTHGDFFDAHVVGPHVVFFLTDIAGTRDQAHPIAAMAQEVFRKRVTELFGKPGINAIDSLSDLAHDINQTFIHSSHGARFAPTFIACYDLSLGLLSYLNAGGQTAILSDSDGTRTIGGVSIPLGLFSHRTYEPAVQAFEPGAKLLLITKGVTEHHFNEEQAKGVLEEFKGNTAFDLCKAALDKAQKFRQRPWYRLPFLKSGPVEDLTAVALLRSIS